MGLVTTMRNRGGTSDSKAEAPIMTAVSDVQGSAVNVSVKNLSKLFTRAGGAEVKAVDDLSLDIHAGEIVALVGPSGCGKTTLLRCIAGLEIPTAGEITINGKTMYSADRHVFVAPENRDISMMFQSYAIWPHMTVEKNVAYPLRARGVKRSEVKERVASVLEIAGIADLKSQMPGRLSGGQQQRVALARSLVVEPSVILFDEPLSNVDAKVREQLRIEILEMHRRLGFAALYVTHDQEEAMRMGQHVAVVDHGKFAQFGTAEEIYRTPASRYVAQFVGTSNEFEGVLRADGEKMSLETPNAIIQIDPSLVHDSCEIDSRVVGVVRPESFVVGTPSHIEAAASFSGRVVASMFLGAYREYVVDTETDVIIVRSTLDDGVVEGDRIELTLPLRGIQVLPQNSTFVSSSHES